MTTLTIIGLAALGVVALLLGIGIVAKVVLNGMKAPLEARIAAVYRADVVLMKDLGAN